MAFYMQFAVGADNEQIATNKYEMKIAQRYRKALDFKRNRVLLGGAGVLKDEHSSEAPVSPSNAVSISSSGTLSMLNGFLLALMMRVKWSSYR